MDEIDRSKPIFESMVPIKLCIGDKDEKFTSLTVRILSGFKVSILLLPISNIYFLFACMKVIICALEIKMSSKNL